MKFDDLSRYPLKLKQNRVRRPFVGGNLLDEWQGKKNSEDGNMPEEWVSSTIEARNTSYIPNEGLSRVEIYTGEIIFLRDIIASDPVSFLGEKHVAKHGDNISVLVKILDSYSRLMIQVHPDNAFAKKVFNSDFGKTEAWYIIGGRKVNGDDPYVLLGFKPGITREKWKRLFEKQDIKGMEDALHKFTVKPGDIFFVEGGVPHAVGTGCFLMEIQEPTDFTIRTEKTSPIGLPISELQMHQNAGFDKMFDCFHYNGFTREEVLGKWHITHQVVKDESGSKLSWIISPQYTTYFSIMGIETVKSFTTPRAQTFSSVVVISGKGRLLWDGGELAINQSDELFLPVGIGDINWESCGGQKLVAVRCFPPAGTAAGIT
ncbi:MAG: hypothetical protein A2Y21_12235 [Clostridiales bacterium GWC2_40_7]|nr:MAG: hypothetical protein A2Y21_12235 [Clostridiales bacterium GWC2_40_7]